VQGVCHRDSLDRSGTMARRQLPARPAGRFCGDFRVFAGAAGYSGLRSRPGREAFFSGEMSHRAGHASPDSLVTDGGLMQMNLGPGAVGPIIARTIRSGVLGETEDVYGNRVFMENEPRDVLVKQQFLEDSSSGRTPSSARGAARGAAAGKAPGRGPQGGQASFSTRKTRDGLDQRFEVDR
jgi:hypothetical protein